VRQGMEVGMPDCCFNPLSFLFFFLPFPFPFPPPRQDDRVTTTEIATTQLQDRLFLRSKSGQGREGTRATRVLFFFFFFSLFFPSLFPHAFGYLEEKKTLRRVGLYFSFFFQKVDPPHPCRLSPSFSAKHRKHKACCSMSTR